MGSIVGSIKRLEFGLPSGIVTRCPLNLILKSTVQGEKKWQARIHYRDQSGTEVKADIATPEDIGNKVREGMSYRADCVDLSDESRGMYWNQSCCAAAAAVEMGDNSRNIFFRFKSNLTQLLG